MKDKLLGKWRSHSWRTAHTNWEPDEPRFIRYIVLNADGTAETKYEAAEFQEELPMPPLWELRNPDSLIIYYPVGPVPEAGISDWSREEIVYRIASVTDDELILDKNGEDLQRFVRVAAANGDILE